MIVYSVNHTTWDDAEATRDDITLNDCFAMLVAAPNDLFANIDDARKHMQLVIDATNKDYADDYPGQTLSWTIEDMTAEAYDVDGGHYAMVRITPVNVR